MDQTRATNPEKEQDRVFDLVDHFDRFGNVMFKQQRTIYNNIADKTPSWFSILEFGCGNGVGTAILNHDHPETIGTDKVVRNVDFARQLYPWIEFYTHDIKEESTRSADTVVAVEVFEHVSDPEKVMYNLLHSARKEVYVTTPDGANSENPPSNPYHVAEYTKQEMLSFIPPGPFETFILDWKTFDLLPPNATCDPLVYNIRRV